MTIHYLPHLNLSQTLCVTLGKPPFLYHFNFKSSSKRYGFSLSHYIFLVLSIIFLNLWVVFNIGFLGVSIMGLVIFVEFECIGLVVYAFKMLHFSVIIIVFMFWVSLLICNVLSVLSALYCYDAVHFMLVVVCLNDSYLCFWAFIDYIVPTHLTHQCFSCLNAAFFFHLPHLCALFLYFNLHLFH